MVEKLDPQKLNNLVKNTESPLVIDCYADWCGPCKQSSPRFERLSQKYSNVRFAKVNVDEQQSIAFSFKIKVVPTFFILRGKKIVKKVEGANIPKLEAELQKELKKYYQ